MSQITNTLKDEVYKEELDKLLKSGGVYSGKTHVFAVKYSLDNLRKNFFLFYCIGYKATEDSMEFYAAKVPISTVVETGSDSPMQGIVQYSQSISAPIIDRKLATVFIYKRERPDWFDKSEEDVLKSLEAGAAKNAMPLFNKLINPLVNQIIKKV